MYRHILIPTDGSELAEHGLAQGLALAKSLGAKEIAAGLRGGFRCHHLE